MTALVLRDLCVGYDGREVVHGLSLGVAAGEIVALVGASGSGKSSVALAAAGLPPDTGVATGTITTGGAIGILFQDPLAALNPALTIGRQIGEAWHGPRRDRRAAVAAAMAEVGLAVPPDRHPHALSGGQRQRALLAMALIARPALLIADEPTAALDPTARAAIADLLAKAARERAMGLLLVTHDLALAARIADRVVALANGRVIETLSAARLGTPSSPILAAQVAAARTVAPAAPPPPGSPVLALANVTRRLGRRWGRAGTLALDGVSLTIAAGEAVGLIGESGAGKTSLARIALGLDHADEGVVTHTGAVQAVFQDPAESLDPRWTIARIVAEPLRRIDAAGRERRVAAALAALELPPELADRLPHMLSGGQRQRVALARALAPEPALLVLDEALSALDPRLRGEMVALLRRLQRARGLAYLLIGHDLEVMRGAVDRIAVMRAGRIVEQGAAAALLATPADPYTAALVAASPTLDQALAVRDAS